MNQVSWFPYFNFYDRMIIFRILHGSTYRFILHNQVQMTGLEFSHRQISSNVYLLNVNEKSIMNICSQRLNGHCSASNCFSESGDLKDGPYICSAPIKVTYYKNKTVRVIQHIYIFSSNQIFLQTVHVCGPIKSWLHKNRTSFSRFPDYQSTCRCIFCTFYRRVSKCMFS